MKGIEILSPSKELFRGAGMEKVTGIGGVSFRAKNPDAVGRWYQENLGVLLTPRSYEDLP